MAEKIVKDFFLQKFNWKFPRNYRPHPTHQNQWFLFVGVCCQISRSFPCNVDVIGGNSQYLLIRFIDCDHSFQKKSPRFFCTNVSIKTFVFVENLSKWQTRAKFFASEPFLPQKVQQLQRSLNCLKGRRFFSPKQLAASTCYAFFSL